MNILVAPDKFRGSLEAEAVCDAVTEGILRAFPEAKVTAVPLADGGEGTARILTRRSGGKEVSAAVSDPLGRSLNANYGISLDGQVAFIEMAAASGLNLLAQNERNPLNTTTFGTGELIRDALDKKVSKIILGIGGSATTDAGLGMAAALGYRFLDKNEKELTPNGGNMSAVTSIDTSNVDPRLRQLSVVVACDVTNPLYGEQGAAFIYGPQKGADPEMVKSLDEGLQSLAKVAADTFGKDYSMEPGAGAAGGLGAGCMWFLNAVLRDGVSIVLEQSNVTELVKSADLVITGEGKIDEQTLSGKVVKGLATFCRQYNVPLAAICGTLQISPEQAREAGITYAVSALNRPMELETAQQEAFTLVSDATFHLARLFFANSKSV